MDHVAPLVERLNGHKRLRLWSVIVTFLGDAIAPRGGVVSARTVQQLMTRLGFEEGAIRTAFSRLVADGWVVREKVGRSSYYRLSQTGAETFVDATRRIYAPLSKPDSIPADWTIVFTENDFANPQFLPGNRPVAGLGLAEEDCLILRGKIVEMPAWFRDHQLSPQYGEAFCQLMADFAPVSNQNFDPLDALAVRCLLIHEWRRILLHLPDMHHLFQPQDWPQERCHHFISALYHRLIDGSEQWMDENGEGENGRLPPPTVDLTKRFR